MASLEIPNMESFKIENCLIDDIENKMGKKSEFLICCLLLQKYLSGLQSVLIVIDSDIDCHIGLLATV